MPRLTLSEPPMRRLILPGALLLAAVPFALKAARADDVDQDAAERQVKSLIA